MTPRLARLERAAMTVAAAALVACTSNGDATPGRDAGKATRDLCDSQLRETYTADISHITEDGKAQVHIADAVPAPPQQGENRWLVRVTDRADRPLHGTSIGVSAFIPSRGYGSARAPHVEVDATDDSLFHVTGLFLELPGVWRITVHVFDAPAKDGGVDAAPPVDAGPIDDGGADANVPDAADDSGALDGGDGSDAGDIADASDADIGDATDDGAPSDAGDASRSLDAGDADTGPEVSFSFCVAS